MSIPTAMTPRERWLAAAAGERPDRVPCDYWGTAEVTGRLLRELGCATERDLWRRLAIDKCIHVAPTHPRAKEDTWHIQSLFSIWGVEVRTQSYAGGLGTYEEDAFHPLAAARSVVDVDGFAWPDPCEFDVSGIRAQCQAWPDHPRLGGSYEPFYLYCRLRGMEQALEDLVTNPEIAEAILGHIHRIHEAILSRMLDAAGDLLDFVYVAEDLGTQRSLLMSPAAFRHFLKPRLSRMIELVHSYDVKVFHHDDGAIRPLIPDLIEAGIDLLNPIQWRCHGMEREALVRDFGPRLIFHGAMDNQHTLPHGSPDDVRREVAENIRTFGSCKGYVVAPCHNLQPVTPTANILALYEAVEEYGRR